MTDLALIIENLTFRYHSRNDLALQNISFSVQKGEILLIAGASGCGKTTLARCINGLIPRSYKGDINGSILIQGREMNDQPLARVSQVIGTVLQDPERQILGTRVTNEVAFGLENLGLPRPQIALAVNEALQRLGITHLQDRETFHLSGGEKQKVALAGVLAMNPSILLLDEPLASLDPASAKEALAAVRRLADEGMTVLMVEHRVEDVIQINPDRVLFMEDGKIRYLGPLSGLYGSVNYHQVKLPAPEIMRLAKNEPSQPDILPFLSGNIGLNPKEAPLVQYKNVSFWYEKDHNILENISLDIRRGDIIAILGPNGAGKTTLVKHAIGLLKPKSGRVMVEGRDTQELSVAQVAATLGYVFQSPSHMLFAPTVKEELAFGPTNLGHKADEIEKEVSESLDTVHLAGMEKYPPLALSFGQQKRVSIAAVLAMRSRILVMDEPTAGQDYQNYMDFMNAILQMNGFDGILFITHDVDLAVVYANRVLLMNEGRIVADGKPVEVMRDFERLNACRVVPTSLLIANLALFSKTGRFLRADMLAHV
jgi:energy-coupling factor transporter ATP-binding protein EcfA2